MSFMKISKKNLYSLVMLVAFVLCIGTPAVAELRTDRVINTGTATSVASKNLDAGNTFTVSTSTENGGALYNIGTFDGAIGASFIGNNANLYGGAICTSNDLSIAATSDDVIFRGNTAKLGSAIYVGAASKTITLTANEGKKIVFEDNQTISNNCSSANYDVKVEGDGTVEFSQVTDAEEADTAGIHFANVTVGTDSGDKATLHLSGKAMIRSAGDIVVKNGASLVLDSNAKIKDATCITINAGGTLTANADNVTNPSTSFENNGTYNMTGGTNTAQIFENTPGNGSTLNILGDVKFGEYSPGNRASIGQTNINIGGTNGEYGALYLHDNDGNISAENGLTLAENGFINLNDMGAAPAERPFRSLAINNTKNILKGNGGTFVINTNLATNSGDDITLAKASGNAKVQVAYDPFFATANDKEILTGSHTFLKVTTGTITITAKETKFDRGGSSFIFTPTVVSDDNKTWKITALSAASMQEVVSETTKAVSDSASMLSFAWISTVNNLQKRMGDLRGGEASNMAWARFQRSNDDVNVGSKQNLSGNLYQIGYDFLLGSNQVANNYFGLSFDVFDGSQSFKIGGGDAKSMTLSAYYTKVYESGHYFDFIMRYGRFESDTQSYDTTLTDPVLTKLDYAMNGLTLSGEYGYRANLGKGGLYLEPQAEFIYGYLAGTKATSSTGVLADIDSANHFLTRFGLAFGQKVKNFNYYLRGSYYHDFAGTTHVKYGEVQYKQDGAQNWWEVSLGGGWNISKTSYFYAELTKHFKDISNSLNFNLGFRLTL